MALNPRLLICAVFLTICTVLIFFFHDALPGDNSTVIVLTRPENEPAEEVDHGPVPAPVYPTVCGDDDLSYLSAYNLTSKIQYASRDIVAVYNSSNERPSVTYMRENLFENLTTIDLNHPNSQSDYTSCLPPLALQVSPPTPLADIDASSLVFGIQSTMARLQDTTKHLSRWLAYTKAQMHAIVQEKDGVLAHPTAMRGLEADFMLKRMNVTLHPPYDKEHTLAQRYFSLVQLLYERRTTDTKWIVVMDDDTFFPSISRILEFLGPIDHTVPQYIGAVSEDADAVKLYGRMAFGGAGIFLSVPMAKVLAEHAQDCNEKLRSSAGDVTIFDCVRRFTVVDLMIVKDLHQVDLYEDQSGLYESGQKLLSVHHWKGEWEIPLDRMHLIADQCNDCFLQRWAFKGEILLTNGYSITHYPFGHLSGESPREGAVLKGLEDGALEKGGEVDKVEKIDLDKVETTWFNWEHIDVKDSLGPSRPKMGEGLKRTFRLLDSMKMEDGAIKQVYVKKGDAGQNDVVMVLNWRAGKSQQGELG